MKRNNPTESQGYSAQSIVVLDKRTPYNPTIDTAFAILGFLDEYLGRQIVEGDEIVEHFYPDEVAAAEAFQNLLHLLQQERGLTTPIERVVGNQGHIYFVSRELTSLVNSYYTANLEIDHTSTRLNKGPFLFVSNQLPYKAFKPVSGAWLKPEEYNPRFSFLLGAYQRYGSENAYTFSNSTGKADLVHTLLCEIGCDYVGWKSWLKGVPIRNVVEFEPTEDLCMLFGLSGSQDTLESTDVTS
jgi:hypothetical protein